MTMANSHQFGQEVKDYYVAANRKFDLPRGFTLTYGQVNLKNPSNRRRRSAGSLFQALMGFIQMKEHSYPSWYRAIEIDPNDGKVYLYGALSRVSESTIVQAEALWARLTENSQIIWCDSNLAWLRRSMNSLAVSPDYDYAENLRYVHRRRRVSQVAEAPIDWKPARLREHGAFWPGQGKSK